MANLPLPVAAAITVLTLATAWSVTTFVRGDSVDRAAHQLTMGILTASLIIGSWIALTAGGGPRIAGLPSFGLFGFICIGGIWALAWIWRSGRKK